MIYEKEKTRNISFPLGGIGTGCIGLFGNGELGEWEIFNRPNKFGRNGYSHFAIKATRGGESTLRVLHGDTNEDFMGRSGQNFGFGPKGASMAGYPHFEEVSFDGNFPIADLTFRDRAFPAVVRLHAFNPLIPHDAFHSSLPAAFFEWEIENTTNETVSYALAGTVANPAKDSRNRTVKTGEHSGLFLGCTKDKSETSYYDFCLLTDEKDVCVQECWYVGSWQDCCTTYWKNLLDMDRLPPRHYDEPGRGTHGTVAAYVTVPAGGRARIRFVLAWNVPTMSCYWSPYQDAAGQEVTWQNYYATQFDDSLACATYALQNFETLYQKTRTFADALLQSSLPPSVKDAVSANLSVLKSPTTLRLSDGSFWGWEGCGAQTGSCYGTCQHVWNYAYAMPYLFPSLERSMRENTMKYALDDDGKSSFRIPLPLGRKPDGFRACVDGQMGEVIKCYREWKLSGDDAWLKAHAEHIFKMLEYAWSPKNPDAWDADCDGILEGRQHHTLDMELFGPSSWLQGFYLLALDCGSKMATAVGEHSRAALYNRLYEQGKAFTNEQLFNGRYFYHKVDLNDKTPLDRFGAGNYWNEEAKEVKYQIADGCMIDQMLADWHAALIGVNGVFDQEKKKEALRSLYRYNYKSTMREVTNMWRNFALNDEGGTLICTYPAGTRQPAIPVPYCEETMTGFEYALAGLMIAEGMVTEGEQLIKAVRDRYDGEKRNPWNEIECGSNYARSMASYAFMPLYSGFSFDMTEKQIGFAPLNGQGRFLFSIADSWGTVNIDEKSCTLTIEGNPLTLAALRLPQAAAITHVTADQHEIAFRREGDCIRFAETVICRELKLT